MGSLSVHRSLHPTWWGLPLAEPWVQVRQSPVILLANHRRGGAGRGGMGSPTEVPITATTTGKNHAKIKVNQKLAGTLWKKPYNFGARHKCLMLSDGKTLFYQDVTFRPYHCKYDVMLTKFLSFHIYNVMYTHIYMRSIYECVYTHAHTHRLTHTNAICAYVREVRIWKDLTKWFKNSSWTGAGKLRPSGPISPQPVL